jgi:hypothetical protein
LRRCWPQLEKREAFHGERATFHAEQEVFHEQQQVHHRERQAIHVAELEKVRESLARFRVAAASAVGVVGPVEPPAPPPAASKLPPPRKKFVSGLMRLVLENPDLQEPFGPAAVAAEVNRRFRAHLRRLVDSRTVSDVLRRLEREGKIQIAQKGRARHEALYKRRSGGR